jgi:ABC-type bacteriocin/lantibiotic exporter with double-glycine peptidase domain
MVINSIMEIVNISAFLAFVSVIFDNSGEIRASGELSFMAALNQLDRNTRISTVLVVFAISAILSALTKYALVVQTSIVSFAVGETVAENSYRTYLSQDYLNIITTNSSEMQHLLGQQITELITVVTLSLQVAGNVLVAVLLVIFVIQLSGPLPVAVMGLLVAVYTLILRVTSKKLVLNGITIKEGSEKAIRVVSDSRKSIKEIKTNRNFESYVKYFMVYTKNYRKYQRENYIITTSPRFLIELLVAAAITVFGIMVLFGGQKLNSVLLIVAGSGAALMRLLPLCQQIFASILAIRSSSVAVQSVLKFVDPNVNNLLSHSSPILFEKQIECKNVTFHYSENSHFVLCDLNIAIKKGSFVAIHGSSGAGKSTLVNIILGLLTPTAGGVYIDGVDLNHIKQSWSRMISYVPQEVHIFDASVAENISLCFENSSVDLNRLHEVAMLTNVHQIVRKLPLGYDTMLGEDGASLSGGERQRIGVARALYRQSQILVLDEPCSALDSISTNELLSMICSLKERYTIVLIDHGAFTKKFADKIYRLSNGRLALIDA